MWPLTLCLLLFPPIVLVLFALLLIVLQVQKTRRQSRLEDDSRTQSINEYFHSSKLGILRFICCHVCCPPCPARMVAKVAFIPPKPPHYCFQVSAGQGGAPVVTMVIKTKRYWWRDNPILQKEVEARYAKTSSGNKIACVYYRLYEQPKFVILFSHQNACDLGQMTEHFFQLAHALHSNVFGYDYSGYGASSGQPSEQNQLADADAAYQMLTTNFAIAAEKIVLYGQSIGSVAAIYLASKHRTAGVVLHAAFLSAAMLYCRDCSCRQVFTRWCCNPFPSVDRVHLIQVPVLLIHGRKDALVPFSHALELHRRLKKWAVKPLWLDEAEHNNAEHFPEYNQALVRFFEDHLGGKEMRKPTPMSEIESYLSDDQPKSPGGKSLMVRSKVSQKKTTSPTTTSPTKEQPSTDRKINSRVRPSKTELFELNGTSSPSK